MVLGTLHFPELGKLSQGIFLALAASLHMMIMLVLKPLFSTLEDVLILGGCPPLPFDASLLDETLGKFPTTWIYVPLQGKLCPSRCALSSLGESTS